LLLWLLLLPAAAAAAAAAAALPLLLMCHTAALPLCTGVETAAYLILATQTVLLVVLCGFVWFCWLLCFA
jgi:hypothetical protein